MQMTAMQYFDKAMACLRDLGLVPDETEGALAEGCWYRGKSPRLDLWFQIKGQGVDRSHSSHLTQRANRFSNLTHMSPARFSYGTVSFNCI